MAGGSSGIPPKTSIWLTNNANTGGTCFGDSAGPIFADNTNMIVAVTSYGINGNYAGIGAGF
jgi:secreted trypsin-like serine protease